MAESDNSNGYEQVAEQFISIRSHKIGVTVVQEWSRLLPPGSSVLDLGCGSGLPISGTLSEAGFAVYGVDASATMIHAFREQLPSARAQCAAAENFAFFGVTFDGVVAWGLIFLLTEEVQKVLVKRIADALRSEGHFLFSAPRDPVRWHDSLTGRESVSLGAKAYHELLWANKFMILKEGVDDGDNYYYSARKC